MKNCCFITVLLFTLTCRVVFADNLDHQPLNRNISFRISKNERVVGYLVGVMHVLPADRKFQVSKKLEDAIADSDGLVTELGIGQYISFDENIVMAADATRHDARLDIILPKKEMEELLRRLTPRFGNGIENELNTAHPWLVGNSLFGICAIPVSSQSIDGTLAIVAGKYEKPIIALETVEEQVGSLPEYASRIWATYLKSILSFVSRPYCRNEYSRLLHSVSDRFLAGDAPGLKSAMEENYRAIDTREFDNKFIYG